MVAPEVVPGTPEPTTEPAAEPFPDAFAEPEWPNWPNWHWQEVNDNEEVLGPTTEDINMVVYGTPQVPEYKPTSWDISHKLAERGITMRHFVQAFLKDHNLYDAEEELFMRMDDELYEHIEEIINDMRSYPPAP